VCERWAKEEEKEDWAYKVGLDWKKMEDWA